MTTPTIVPITDEMVECAAAAFFNDQHYSKWPASKPDIWLRGAHLALEAALAVPEVFNGMVDMAGEPSETLREAKKFYDENYGDTAPGASHVFVWNMAIEACIQKLPGGHSCDPQYVADSLRKLLGKVPSMGRSPSDRSMDVDVDE